MGFFDQASRKLAEVQKKTGDTIAVYKLQAQIKNIEEDIQRIYATIGDLCYTAHKAGKAPEGLDALYENIDRMKADISGITAEIDALNQVIRCPECAGAVDMGVKFCPNCGCKIPEDLLPKIETCPNCGNVRGEGDRFCENCGYQYDAPVQPEPEEAAEPAEAAEAEAAEEAAPAETEEA